MAMQAIHDQTVFQPLNMFKLSPIQPQQHGGPQRTATEVGAIGPGSRFLGFLSGEVGEKPFFMVLVSAQRPHRVARCFTGEHKTINPCFKCSETQH